MSLRESPVCSGRLNEAWPWKHRVWVHFPSHPLLTSLQGTAKRMHLIFLVFTPLRVKLFIISFFHLDILLFLNPRTSQCPIQYTQRTFFRFVHSPLTDICHWPLCLYPRSSISLTHLFSSYPKGSQNLTSESHDHWVALSKIQPLSTNETALKAHLQNPAVWVIYFRWPRLNVLNFSEN